MKSTIKRRQARVFCMAFLFSAASLMAADHPETDWFKEARLGAFVHVLPHTPEEFALLKKFDVEAMAEQLQAMGAKYLVFTVYQNEGYLNAPNAAYDRYTGYAPGEKCSTRDLPLELYRALKPKGIKLMLYVTGQVPNRDPRAQKAFGLASGAADQAINVEFARKWAGVIQEWSDRYQGKVAGWWFDGCYQWVNFNDEIARIYAVAVQHGNSQTLVAFNPGVKLPVIRATKSENYTAGELDTPFKALPGSRWLDGAQWHALTYLGSRWSGRDTRFAAQQWIDWVRAVTEKEGVVTLDMGPNWDPQAGPIGALAESQVKQFKAIGEALRRSPSN